MLLSYFRHLVGVYFAMGMHNKQHISPKTFVSMLYSVPLMSHHAIKTFSLFEFNHATIS